MKETADLSKTFVKLDQVFVVKPQINIAALPSVFKIVDSGENSLDRYMHVNEQAGDVVPVAGIPFSIHK